MNEKEKLPEFDLEDILKEFSSQEDPVEMEQTPPAEAEKEERSVSQLLEILAREALDARAKAAK